MPTKEKERVSEQNIQKIVKNSKEEMWKIVKGITYYLYKNGWLIKKSLDKENFENLIDDVVKWMIASEENLKDAVSEGDEKDIKEKNQKEILSIMTYTLIDKYLDISKNSITNVPKGSDESLFYTTLIMELNGVRNLVDQNKFLGEIGKRIKMAWDCILMAHNALQITDVVSAFKYLAGVSKRFDKNFAIMAEARLDIVLNHLGLKSKNSLKFLRNEKNNQGKRTEVPYIS